MATFFGIYNEPLQIGLFGLIFLLILTLWTIAWKAIALWISARESKKWWFGALLIFNTAGILDIIYILFFSQPGKKFLNKYHLIYKEKKNRKKKKNQQVETPSEQ